MSTPGERIAVGSCPMRPDGKHSWIIFDTFARCLECGFKTGLVQRPGAPTRYPSKEDPQP